MLKASPEKQIGRGPRVDLGSYAAEILFGRNVVGNYVADMVWAGVAFVDLGAVGGQQLRLREHRRRHHEGLLIEAKCRSREFMQRLLHRFVARLLDEGGQHDAQRARYTLSQHSQEDL